MYFHFQSLFVIDFSQFLISQISCLEWRRALQEEAHSLYFSPICPYAANTIDKRVDNIDHRLTNDIKLFTEVRDSILCYFSLCCRLAVCF